MSAVLDAGPTGATSAIPAQPAARAAAAAFHRARSQAARPRAGGRSERAPWLGQVRLTLVAADLAVVWLAVTAALYARFGVSDALLDTGHDVSVSYAVVGLVVVALWMAALALHGTRDHKVIGSGPDEYKRVLVASIRFFGLLAILAYVARVDLARGFVALGLPLGTAGLLVERWAVRKLLHRGRAKGLLTHRVVVVGEPFHVAELAAELARRPYAGLEVVGACLPTNEGGASGFRTGVARLGDIHEVAEAVDLANADTVIVVPSGDLTPAELRRISWSLEGSGVDLIVAPTLTDVAGPRVHVRPVPGLPLLHIEAPEFDGATRAVKAVFDFSVAAVLTVLLSPLMLAIGLAVGLTSPGGVFFRQQRIGRDGKVFTVYKFRSMVPDAEARLADLRDRNESEGPLFKLRDDPRVTPVGRWLRKLSLDELPQLFNVLRGEMSLVGPRPPLASEVAEYERDVHRRLLVKPGITGLWQVSGRSDLSWEDSVRLDLYYVENWSLTGDLLILARTAGAVLRSSGAY